MSKKTKPPVRRDQDFEELDQELEAAMRALESVTERTAAVLQQVDQGADLLNGDAEAGNATGAATATSNAEPETPAEA